MVYQVQISFSYSIQAPQIFSIDVAMLWHCAMAIVYCVGLRIEDNSYKIDILVSVQL